MRIEQGFGRATNIAKSLKSSADSRGKLRMVEFELICIMQGAPRLCVDNSKRVIPSYAGS